MFVHFGVLMLIIKVSMMLFCQFVQKLQDISYLFHNGAHNLKGVQPYYKF